MKVLKLSDLSGEESASTLFRGRVVLQPVTGGEDQPLMVNVVNFDQGAVNVFHTHATDQVLYVIDGTGIVATEEEEVRVTPGTFIIIPAGEKHWHGAIKEDKFSHISIRTPGETVV